MIGHEPQTGIVMGISLHLLTKVGFPALLCAFALGYRFTIEDAPRAARLFPDSLISLLVVACLFEIGRTIWKHWIRREDDAPEVTLSATQLGVLGAMIAFYPAVAFLGFGIPSLAFLFAVSMLCGATPRQAATVAAIAGLCLYAFVRLTGFELPIF